MYFLNLGVKGLTQSIKTSCTSMAKTELLRFVEFMYAHYKALETENAKSIQRTIQMTADPSSTGAVSFQ